MRRPVRRGMSGPRRASSNANVMNMARAQRRQQKPTPVAQRPTPSTTRRPTNPLSKPIQGQRSTQPLRPTTPRQRQTTPVQGTTTPGAAQRSVAAQQRRSMVPLNTADNKANALNMQMARGTNAPKATPQYSKGGVVHTDYRKNGMFKK